MDIVKDFLEKNFPEEGEEMFKKLSQEGRWLAEQFVGRMDEKTYKPLADAYRMIDHYSISNKITPQDVSILKQLSVKVYATLNPKSRSTP